MTQQEVVLKALVQHFKSVIEQHSGLSFAETKVELPTKTFEGYADAVVTALSQAPLMPVYGSKPADD